METMATSAPEHLSFPKDLPVPKDDGAAWHLVGHPLPFDVALPCTSTDTGGSSSVDLFLVALKQPVMLFVYPRTGRPGEKIADEWNAIPGARGCTPHLCGVRDSIEDLVKKEPGLKIFGLSAETPERQSEVVESLHLPFPLLSDHDLRLAKALELPTFQYQGQTLLKRITILLREGQVTKIDYPVFPPNEAAKRALDLLNPDPVVTVTY